MYDLVFEVGPFPRNLLWPLLFGVVPFIVIGIVIVRQPEQLANTRGPLATRPGRLFIAAFPWGILLLFTVLMLSERARLRAALRRQSYEVVEGRVTGYTPLGPSQRPPESWTVNGHHYEISPHTITMGFNRPGVVREGMQVRIAEVEGKIARLEVASLAAAGEPVAAPDGEPR